MKNKTVNKVIFIISLISLFFSLYVFWGMQVFLVERNLFPELLGNGNVWVYMNWFSLLLSFIICVLSGVSLFRRSK